MEDLFKRVAAKVIKEGPIKAGYALALGHLNRSLGTLSALSSLPSTVSFLQAMARSDAIETQLAAFQALKYTIDSSGAAFFPYVEAVLQLLGQLLFTQQKSVLSNDQHLLLGCAKVLDSMIGLGPELITSKNYIQLFSYFLTDFLVCSC